MNENQIELKMKKGLLEFCVLSVLASGPQYTSDILDALHLADLITVEGTLYPLLNRMTKEGKLGYYWQESTGGPPRKYYKLTFDGKAYLNEYSDAWVAMSKSIKLLNKKRE